MAVHFLAKYLAWIQPFDGFVMRPLPRSAVRDVLRSFSNLFRMIRAAATLDVQETVRNYPNAATAAAVMATKIYWALGYNQVESFVTTFDPKRMEISSEATFVRPNGKRTPVTRADVEELLEHAARRPDGTYRVFAGRMIPGKIIGRFRYQGTRPDDPNDLCRTSTAASCGPCTSSARGRT